MAERRPVRLPTLLLAAALVPAAVLLVAAQWDIAFFQDTFDYLLDRQPWTAHSVLTPWNEHIVVGPVLISKFLLEVFGMSSNTPEQVVMGINLLAIPVLLFFWMRRRVDPWLALIAAVLFLFLGSAWPVLLWPFMNDLTLPLLFGLAMLLALDRDDARGDASACALLVLATLGGTLGLSFVIAAAVDWLLKRRRRGWRRAYVFLVPGLVYLAWYAGWGHEAEHHLTLHNVLESPAYVFDGFATALASLAGLSKVSATAPTQFEWGRPLLVAAIALVAFGQWRRPGFRPGLWTALAAGLSYWLLAAFNYIPGREAFTGRYIYAGALFILLIATELLVGRRFSRRALIVTAAAALLALGPNLAQLWDGSDWERDQSVLTRADLAALEISRDSVDPAFTLGDPEVSGTASLALVGAGPYFEAVDRWGSPAYSVAELESAPAGGRHYADIVLSQALPIGRRTTSGVDSESGAAADCATIEPGAAAGREVKLTGASPRVELAPGPPAQISLRRFATGEFPVALTSAEGGTTTVIEIPPDRAPNPWFVHVEASQAVRVCG